MALLVKIHPARGSTLCPQRSAALSEPPVHSMSITGRPTVKSLIDLPCFQKDRHVCVARLLLFHAIYTALLKSSDISLSMFLSELR